MFEVMARAFSEAPPRQEEDLPPPSQKRVRPHAREAVSKILPGQPMPCRALPAATDYRPLQIIQPLEPIIQPPAWMEPLQSLGSLRQSGRFIVQLLKRHLLYSASGFSKELSAGEYAFRDYFRRDAGSRCAQVRHKVADREVNLVANGRHDRQG
jgi:hypothetical protein